MGGRSSSQRWPICVARSSLIPRTAEAYHVIGDEIHDFDPERAIVFWRRLLALDPRMDVNQLISPPPC